MSIREIRLRNIRSYELFLAELNPKVTLIIGKNGSGKTNLLESLYYLLQGTSFRGRDRDLIAHSSNRAELMATLDSGDVRRATIQHSDDGTVKKAFEISGKTNLRLLARSKLPVVLFEPDELRLLSTSPERRRKFFDGILSRLYPQYGALLNRYQRVLLQRNELLKKRQFMDQKAWDDQLFVWDIKFAELALAITRQRREFVVTSNSSLSNLYTKLAKSKHRITSSYHASIPADNYQQLLMNHLHGSRIADSHRGYTTAGPHRDDFELLLDGHPAQDTASRGEMRTIMLAYKLLEVELQREAYSEAPLILMDDVFSELDTTRERQLMHALKNYQTIITATDLRDELKINASIINLNVK